MDDLNPIEHPMKKVFILGTAHVAEVKQNLKDKVSTERIQALIKEAVSDKGGYTLENFVLEPFFLVFTFIWFRIPVTSTDARSLVKLSKECNIAYHEDIDATLTELIKFMYAPLNYFIALAILLVSVFIVSFSLRSAGFPNWTELFNLIGLASAILGYSVIMIVIKTPNFRNEMMVSKTITKMTEKNYSRIIFACGDKHRIEISKLFREKGFEVEELTDYQHPLVGQLSKFLP